MAPEIDGFVVLDSDRFPVAIEKVGMALIAPCHSAIMIDCNASRDFIYKERPRLLLQK